jgi:hypothetical protein
LKERLLSVFLASLFAPWLLLWDTLHHLQTQTKSLISTAKKAAHLQNNPATQYKTIRD